MYFGFDGNTEGFERILSRIADNHEGGKHNHKQVRAYARCLLLILAEINIDFDVKPEVQILLAAVSAPGLPHHDRAFLAEIILKLLENSAKSKTENPIKDTADIPF
jgi:PIN domain nuclease of toxin-antitoxin system